MLGARFRLGPIACWILALALAIPAWAEELPPEMEIQDNGARRKFEPAHSRPVLNEKIVLYEKGVSRRDAARRVLTSRVHVQLAPGIDAARLAAALGAKAGPELSYAPGHYIFRANGPRESWSMAEKLRARPEVISADPVLARDRKPKVPVNDPLFPRQWHLLNQGQNGATPGVDINVTNVWNTYRGAGVTIAIVDDGVSRTHPDLVQNVNTSLGIDIRDQDSDPSPEGGPGVDDFGEPFADSHGTAVAGLAAARGGNGTGGAGVAFESSIIAVRLLGGDVGDDEEAQALSYMPALVQVSNNSWGGVDDGESLGGAGRLVRLALESGTATGRKGLGVIYVFAAGNGGEWDENANYDTYANSIHTIAVGAVNDRGRRASYSEPGTCLIVCAPGGNDAFRFQGITTIDLPGNYGYNYAGAGSFAFPELADLDYTQNFSGTSAAAPMVSGVVALMLQANPGLGWRDVQEILIRSATRLQPNDPKWVTNNVGLRFNSDFGAGLVNAEAAVNLAVNWPNLGPKTELVADLPNLNRLIPRNDLGGLEIAFQIPESNFRAEHVTLNLDALISRRGNLDITLTSPSGIVSHLAEARFDPNPDYNRYTFMTVFNWGENPSGIWKLKVADHGIYPPHGPAPMVLGARLTVHGAVPIPKPVLAKTQLIDDGVRVTVQGLAGETYELQATSDFLTWVEVDRVNAPGHEFELIDSAGSAALRRFYRVQAR